ncbi:MAG: hypothetical protein ACLFO5_04660 [Opitutales bacterium]
MIRTPVFALPFNNQNDYEIASILSINREFTTVSFPTDAVNLGSRILFIHGEIHILLLFH